MTGLSVTRRVMLGGSGLGVAVIASTISASATRANPAVLTLMIIRHAEKPLKAWPGPGITLDGTPDQQSLVIRGWQRAGSWAALFGTGLGASIFPKPDLVYAAQPSSKENDDASNRPYETIMPLAARLGISPIVSYAVGQQDELIAAVTQHSGVVLVCWEHKKIISAMLPAVVKNQAIPSLPPRWHASRFDVVLRFDRPAPDAPWSFRELFPCLLSGDNNTLMS